MKGFLDDMIITNIDSRHTFVFKHNDGDSSNSTVILPFFFICKASDQFKYANAMQAVIYI